MTSVIELTKGKGATSAEKNSCNKQVPDGNPRAERAQRTKLEYAILRKCKARFKNLALYGYFSHL